jgi:hypothetical protein
MIRSDAIPGLVYGDASDGDARSDALARARLSSTLGIPSAWATISQVHGGTVVVARRAGSHGDADAVVTDVPGLPIAIGTADCVPVAIAGERTIALAHAGWRGVVAGVVPAALRAMEAIGDVPVRASIGPHIGPCCYEVGTEVVDAIGGHEAATRAGGLSVDLAEAIVGQLGGLPTEVIDVCTLDDDRFASYRRNGTSRRQVAVAWLSEA